MNEKQVINALGSLSHQMRLRIMKHLIAAGERGMSAGDIGDAIKAAPSKASFHLAVLERADLVKSIKVSRQVIYRARYKKIGQVLNYMMADCCSNHPEILSCCTLPPNDNCC